LLGGQPSDLHELGPGERGQRSGIGTREETPQVTEGEDCAAPGMDGYSSCLKMRKRGGPEIEDLRIGDPGQPGHEHLGKRGGTRIGRGKRK